jgi:hypothetical protein
VNRGSFGDLPIKFDVPECTLTVVDTESDSPGEKLYYIWVKNSRSIPMWISELEFYYLTPSFQGWRTFSEHIEKGVVRNVNGRIVGEDHWGVWKEGERWRLVVFPGHEEVGYPPTPNKQAELFDQVISSACFSASPTH